MVNTVITASKPQTLSKPEVMLLRKHKLTAKTKELAR